MISKNVIITNAKGGASLGARLAALGFAVDAVALIAVSARAGESFSSVGAALLAAAGLYGVIAASLAILLALSAVYVGGTSDLVTAARARANRIRRYLFSRDPQTCRDFTAAFAAFALGILIAVALSVFATVRAVADIRTPIFSAAVAVGCTSGVLLLTAASALIWRRTGVLLAKLVMRDVRPVLQIAIFAAFVAAVGAAFIVRTWDSVGFALPWRGPIFSAAFSLSAAMVFLFDLGSRVSSRALLRTARATGLVLSIAGMAFAAAMPQSLAKMNVLIEECTGPLSAAHALAEKLLDFDGDGYLSVLGQGDCAPFDASVNPGAHDVPRDGIDQNCSGRDRSFELNIPAARHDYPVTPKPAPMPVILVTIDSVSAPDLDLYGAARKTMPELTRFARSAVVFDRAFAFGPATRLSLPSVVTGRYMSSQPQKPKPTAHGVWGRGNVTLAEMLSAKGYATIAVAPDPYFSKTLRWIYQGFEKLILDPASGPDGLTAPLVTDAALAALREAGPQNRLFLWVHYNDAHLAGKDYALPKEITPFPGGAPKDEHDTKLLYIDSQIKRLLDGVDDLYGENPRMVIVSADHGESFDADHVAKAKARHAWDLSTSVTHIPLIIASPYGKPGRTARLASNMDIVPTVLNGLGFSAKDIEGDSLLPTIATGADPNRPIMQQMFYPEYIARKKPPLARIAVRKGSYVLYRHSGAFFLFDFVRDPGEKNDLAARMPALTEELADTIEAMLGGGEEEPREK